MSGWREAEVISARFETDAARTLRLRAPGLGGNAAGQHIDIRLTAADGYTAQRSYSLATAEPGDEAEVTIEELADGEVSPYLVREVQPGDRLEVRGPVGGWFVWRPDDTAPVVLIAGGSGVVPLMAMIRQHHTIGSTVPFSLVYSTRSPATLIFGEELERIAAADASFALDVVYTREAPEGSTRTPARLTKADVVRGIPETSRAGSGSTAAQFFVCGPTGFVETVANRLVDDGYPAERIKTERFGGV